MVLTKVYNERDLGFADANGARHGFSSRREVPAHGHWAAQSEKKNNLFPSGILPQTPTHTVHPFSKLETMEASLTTPLMSECSMNKISHSLNTAAS